MAQPTVVLFDSGVVAAGAEIITPALDLRGLKRVEMFVDNTAATVFRDLNMLTYLDDATTLIDTLLLRKCGFGAAPSGSVYAPGRVYGHIGPTPPGGVTGVHVLADATSGVNAAQTLRVTAEDAECLYASMVCSAGTAFLTVTPILDDGSAGAGAVQQAAAASAAMHIAAGLSFSIANANGQSSAVAVRRWDVTASAPGAGNTSRLVVQSRGRLPGVFWHATVLPNRVKFQLAAAGAAAARVVVLGR